MKQTRRWAGWLSMVAGGFGALAAAYAVLVERTQVELDEFTISVDKPGLPPEGLTILHITDLHCRKGGRVQERKIAGLARLLGDTQYDILAVTGDLIHDEPGFPAALAWIQSLRPRFATYTCPGNHDYCESSVLGVFGTVEKEGLAAAKSPWARARAVLGNVRLFVQKMFSNQRIHLPVAFHDVDAMNATLERCGIQPLVNCATRLQADGVDLWVAGVDDMWEGKPDLGAALAAVPESALLLLLAHNPDAWLDRRADRADLILSGHVHGGQVRLPVLGALHTQGTHLSRRMPAGWFQRGTTHMYVSRGLGESLPVRLGSRPQAALIRLVPVSS